MLHPVVGSVKELLGIKMLFESAAKRIARRFCKMSQVFESNFLGGTEHSDVGRLPGQTF